MSAKLIAVEGEAVRIELTIKLSRSWLQSEETILSVLNEAGCIATGEALKRFDTEGSAILMGGAKWTRGGPSAETQPWPMGDQRPPIPLPATMDAAAMKAAVDQAFDPGIGKTRALGVVHKGQIIVERYAPGFDKETRHAS